MGNKIVFVCVNPVESFLPPVFQGHMRTYFEWVCKAIFLRDETMYCNKRIELYGESEKLKKEMLFQNMEKVPQLLYLQSNQKELLAEACKMADLIIVGMSASKKECDKIFLAVLPWKDKVLFLWDDCSCDEQFLKQIQKEYGVDERQLMEAKKLPLFLAEALHYSSSSERSSSDSLSRSGR